MEAHFPIFKMVHSSNIRCFLEPVFAKNNSNLSADLFLICFWQFYFLTQYSLCVEAFFGNIQNGLTFRILGYFRAVFLHRISPLCLCFFGIGNFIFLTQTDDFATLSTDTIFPNIQNRLIFLIFAFA